MKKIVTLVEVDSLVEYIATTHSLLCKDGFNSPTLSEEFKTVINCLYESALLKQQVAQSMSAKIIQAANVVSEALERDCKVLLCGNGGSAAVAQHIAAELVGRFKKERNGFPVLALTADTSILTAVANDYGFNNVFARQVKAIARSGDVLIAISTSGESKNVIQAVEIARNLGVTTIGLLGNKGGKLAELVNLALVVPSTDTPRLQEVHLTLGHIICDLVDTKLTAHV